MNTLELEVGKTYRFTYISKVNGIEKLSWKVATVESVTRDWIKTNKWYVPATTILMIEEWN